MGEIGVVGESELARRAGLITADQGHTLLPRPEGILSHGPEPGLPDPCLHPDTAVDPADGVDHPRVAHVDNVPVRQGELRWVRASAEGPRVPAASLGPVDRGMALGAPSRADVRGGLWGRRVSTAVPPGA